MSLDNAAANFSTYTLCRPAESNPYKHSKSYSREMEPPFYFVRDSASRVAHHWDYLRNRTATALCGHDYRGEIRWEGDARPAKVCRSCQDVLPQFEAKWWRQGARRIEIHRDRLEKRNAEIENELTQLRRQINQLTYQLELSKETIVSQKQKIENQRKTLHHLQSARAAQKAIPHALSLARVMGPPDCQGDGTTVARYRGCS
ncbi:hypothetical protein, partial [Mycolicibacterium peregrinum]